MMPPTAKSPAAEIPKIVHYCWFGGGEKPASVKYNIACWHRILPNYEFLEWNEHNSDLNESLFAQQALSAKKYAFVSDYIRAKALYELGGVYLDTDVEVLKPFDDILKNRSVWGFEVGNYVATSTILSEARHPYLDAYLSHYRSRLFLNGDGSYDITTNVIIVTRILERFGLQRNGMTQNIGDDAIVLNRSFFSPRDYISGSTQSSPATYTIHHFNMSWLDPAVQRKILLKRALRRLFGSKVVSRLTEIYRR
jgi:hypothetical protein